MTEAKKLHNIQQFYDHINNLKQTTFREHLLAQVWSHLDNGCFRAKLCQLFDKYNKEAQNPIELSFI